MWKDKALGRNDGAETSVDVSKNEAPNHPRATSRGERTKERQPSVLETKPKPDERRPVREQNVRVARCGGDDAQNGATLVHPG